MSPVKIVILLLAILAFLKFSCGDNPVINQNSEIQSGSWLIYSPLDWGHDGNPHESVYFQVYSDGASENLKKRAGAFADKKFEEILQMFNFENLKDFKYPPGYQRLDLYINQHHEENLAAAYWGSIFITIRSDNADLNFYDYLFRHELTHLFQFLIEGHVNLSSEIWFSEGIAIYGGGGLWGIRNAEDLENWKARNAGFPNEGNPISIHTWDDFPPGADITGYYYNVFDLTMRYILDESGLGKSPSDICCLFYDLREGMRFPIALQKDFDLDIKQFEHEYYSLMKIYLSDQNTIEIHKSDLIYRNGLCIFPVYKLPVLNY